MTALGRGKVDLPLIQKALIHPVAWVIELDECATDPLESERRILMYLDSQMQDIQENRPSFSRTSRHGGNHAEHDSSSRGKG